MWPAPRWRRAARLTVRTDTSAGGAVSPVIAGSIDWLSSVGVSVTSPLVILTGQRVDGRRRVGEGLLEFAAREGRQRPQRRRLHRRRRRVWRTGTAPRRRRSTQCLTRRRPGSDWRPRAPPSSLLRRRRIIAAGRGDSGGRADPVGSLRPMAARHQQPLGRRRDCSRCLVPVAGAVAAPGG